MLFQTQQGSGCDCGFSRRRRCCCAQYVFTRPFWFQKTKKHILGDLVFECFRGDVGSCVGVGSEVQESHHRTVRLVWFYQAGQNAQKNSGCGRQVVEGDLGRKGNDFVDIINSWVIFCSLFLKANGCFEHEGFCLNDFKFIICGNDVFCLPFRKPSDLDFYYVGPQPFFGHTHAKNE